MAIHDAPVLRFDGEEVSLFSLSSDKPVAIVFLRHLGCVFCRQQVGTLRDSMPDANIVFVTMSDARLTDRFRTWMRSPHSFLCDPQRKLYEAFGVPRSTAGKYFSATVVRKALQAYRQGYRNSLNFDDQLQLGGAYVMNGDGKILASFASDDISTQLDVRAIAEALSAEEAEASVSESRPSSSAINFF